MKIDEINQLLDSGLAVYEYFLGQVKLGKKILSPLRGEGDPSFSVYVNRNKGLYYWKDSGSGEFGDHWDFIKRKCNLNFRESVDFARQQILNLGSFGVDMDRINNAALMLAAKPKVKIEQIKAKIIPQFRSWTPWDEAYFQKRNGMSCADMEAAWYLPVSSAEVVKPERNYTIWEGKDDPIYAICFPSGNFKLWRPKQPSKRKWVSNVDRESDFYLLNRCTGGDVLLLLAGNRDSASVWKHLNIHNFALLSETALLPFELFQQLTVRYKKIYSLYDNDAAGIKGAIKLEKTFGIPGLNEVYKPFEVNDFSELLEEKRESLDDFALFLYSKI